MGQAEEFRRPVALVVEDEPLQRMMAVDLVEEAGFDVIEATNADEAILLLETRLDIRVVFTDIDMPGSMDGMMLAAAVRKRWPPIEIIITPGHVRERDLVLPERGVFFPKPYDSERLSRKLVELRLHHRLYQMCF
ncbi:response regulator [Rhizobium wenxiniae]|uniref:response regulator n=1 Tax=Rhizobium wenxiniae TaxID=1737357 RepID=UPI003C282881